MIALIPTEYKQCECLSQVITPGSSQGKRLSSKLCSLLDSYREMLHVPH
jgi:hypothetical protein